MTCLFPETGLTECPHRRRWNCKGCVDFQRVKERVTGLFADGLMQAKEKADGMRIVKYNQNVMDMVMGELGVGGGDERNCNDCCACCCASGSFLLLYALEKPENIPSENGDA